MSEPDPLQRRLWFLEQLDPGRTCYLTAGALRLRGDLDEPALAAALAGLPERHPRLRVRCADRAGAPVVLAGPPAPPLLRGHAGGAGPAPDRAVEQARDDLWHRLTRALAGAAPPAAFAAGVATLGPADHLLVLAVHQAAGDAGTVAALLAELGARYASLVGGAGSPDPSGISGLSAARPVGRDPDPDPDPDPDWHRRLAAAPAMEPPADRARPAVWQPAGAAVPFAVPAGSPAAAGAATAWLLAATHLLLARHSGQWRGALGVTAGGTVTPVPLDLAPATPFAAAVRRAGDALASARGADAERLAPRLAPGADLSRNPLFGVLVDVVVEPPPGFGPLSVAPVPVRARTTRYDLVVRLRIRPGGTATGELEYPVSLFDHAGARRLATRMSRLLAGAAADPERPIGRLPLLPAAERRSVLPPPARPASPVPPLPVLELIAHQAARTPDQAAVESGGRRLTYRELVTLADRVAGRLRRVGVSGGDLVGVAVPRGVHLLAALLGAWRAGAAYLPLDPEHPPQRLAGLLADAGVAALVCDGPPPAPVPPPAAVVRLDQLPLGQLPLDRLPLDRLPLDRLPLDQLPLDQLPLGQVPEPDPPGPRGPVSLDHPAYVIYTSGSTGRPKGVVVPHRALTNFLWSMRERPGLPAGATVPAVTTVSFDIAALELFLPLLVGGRVVISEPGEARNPDRLMALLDRTGARVMQATPVTWRLLLDAGWDPPEKFTAFCGGERLPAGLAGRLRARGVRLWDLYGPTETTVWSSVTAVGPDDFTPVANTSLYVLDDRLEPVPPGGRGELYIGGHGVATGYLRQPGLTADRFLPDPYGPAPGARLYRTGDLARRHPGGRIEILGRTDHQLKIRGFRVEPAEIAQVLASHPRVRDAAVTAEPAGGDHEPRLVGYVVATGPGDPPDEPELRRHCARLLPPYLVPARFVVLDAFPTTSSGKLDRAALPAPDPAEPGPVTGRAPATATERRVAGVLAELLDRPAIGADEDFFALGGHSLLATRAVRRLAAASGVDLPVAALFEARTVAGLAARIEATRREAGGRDAATPELVPAPGTGPPPLSYAQQRMWFLHQLDPDGTDYLEPLAIRLPEPLDRDRLHQALDQLFARHEVLRTRYPAGAGGGPVPVVAPPAPVRPPAGDGSPTAVLAEELARPFDLATGPPVRVRLVRSGGRHTLVFVLHHIATDDRSHEVIAADLLAAYQGRPLPPLPVRYVDYAAWQRRRLTGDRVATGLRFWRDRLAGLEPAELPTDRPRPATRDPRGGTVRFRVPPAVVARLDAIGRRHRATRFLTLLAGFFALLSRCTGRTDLAVGVPVSGRDRAEVADLVGLFVNTIVLRTRLPEGGGFARVVAQVAGDAAACLPHAEIPFDLVVEGLAPRRAPGRNPLFGILFAWHPVPPPGTGPVPDLPAAKVDLGCHLTERADGGLDGRLEYPRALYDRATIERFARLYQRLLAAAGQAPDTPVARLALLTSAEADRLGAAGPPAPDPDPVPDLIAARAARATTVAVRGAGPTLSYPELDRRANRLAHRLRELGAGRGGVVAVRLPRTPDLVVALLAVLRAGAAYLPLDPEHPAARLRQVLAEAGAPLLIGPAGTTPELPDRVRLVALDDPAERARIRTRPATAPVTRLCPDDLAYVVYTSGSTGRPKGVMVTHGGLANYTRWAAGQVPGSAAGAPLHTSIAYDLALTALWPVLVAGGTVTLVPEPASGVEPLAKALTDRPGGTRYGLVKLTPTHLDLLAGTLPPAAVAGATGCLVVAGEALRGEQLRAWSTHAPGTVVVNSYGPSETAVACAAHRVPAGEVTAGPVPIGRPITGASAHLLDDAMRPVPPGVVGEIYVGGRGVGRGYLADPRRTADRFLPDPYAERPGARLYRTGDLARRRDDGALVFLGRRDDQVQIRGFRVEPGEAERLLAAHPAVAAAAVVADHADPGNPRLAAYVVPARGPVPGAPDPGTPDPGPPDPGTPDPGTPDPGTPDLAGLRAYLADRLPDHQVPTLWRALPELPLLPNGKLDRRGLPRPSPAATRIGGYTAPATPVERTVAAVWAEVLGVDRVGRHDRFFDLGGQSLLATRAVARLRERLGAPVSVAELFAAPTVAGLAQVLAGRTSAPALTPAPVPPAGGITPRTGPPPLSFAQQRLWFLDQLRPGGTEYLVVTGLRLRGRLDKAALAAALRAVVARHEVLRTRYPAGPDGEPVPVVDDPPEEVPLAVVDADPGEALAAEAARPVDLARGPVLRARLVRARLVRARGGPVGEHVLILVVHHIATDGWSARVLAAELAAAYRGEALAPLPLQYGDFAAWQRGHLTGPPLEDLLGYWRARLAGLEPTELPADHPRPAVPDGRGAVVRFDLPADLTGRVDALGRDAGATPFMTYLAGFFALLARYTRGTDLAVGVPVAGRGGDRRLEDLIGCFVNTVVLRADLRGNPSFHELLGRVRAAATEAYRHDELPFDRLVAELAPERSGSRHPLFQLLFAVREEGLERLALPGLAVRAEAVPVRTAKFDLTLELTRRPGGRLTGEIEYATALFAPATVRRLARHYRNLLRAVADRPHARLGALEVLDPAERRALLDRGRGAAVPPPEPGVPGPSLPGPSLPGPSLPGPSLPGPGLPELVAAQAARTPDAVAVASGADRLTYRDLDRAANRLAHHLRAAGVGRDDVVAVCLPRRPDLVVALLGTQRAGAAFLPLDPAHPASRRAWMLRDAGARLLIADAGREPPPPGGPPVLDLAAAVAAIAARPAAAAPVGTDPDGLAYVIYTSGSTGRPKGVAVPHRGIRNRVLWAVRRHGLGPADRLLQKTAITFDASVWEFFGPLVSGGTVVLAPEGAERDPARMVEVLATERVTVLQGVPSFLRTLADEPGLDRCTGLRLLFSGGEPLPAELAARLTGRLPAVLVNTYGPTECAIDVTAWQFRPGDGGPGDGGPGGTVPIGRPLDNLRLMVYGPDGALAPTGVPGELHAAGDGLARGYLGHPRLTADRFVPDPTGPPGSRAYRTGDLVRCRPDGVLEFRGRADHQVKIRGVRIEVAEVEAVLTAHPAVAAAAVTARPGPDGLPWLVGYLVPRDAPPPVRSVREFVLARLPEAYLPSAFVTVPRLPLTTSGKVDRAALPEPDRTRPDSGPAVPARTPAERAVAAAIAEVLGLAEVGATDDFFELGGHSLLAVRVASRIRAALGVDLPVRALFEHRGVAALAAYLSGLAPAGEGGIPRLDPARRRGPVPLSSGQLRLWFLHRLEPDGTRYHVAWALRLTGRLDPDALAGAVSDLFARHDALRTRYPTGAGGEPAQVVEPAAPVRLAAVDVSPAELPGRLRTLAGQRFDLAERPPVAAHLLRLGPAEHVFLLVSHHIAGDARSQEVLAHELGELYAARRAGRPAALDPPARQYPDYAAWQRSHLTGERVAAELSHWRDRLAGLPRLELPTDRPRPPVTDGRGGTVELDLPAEVAGPLLALGRRHGATPYMTLLSVFAVLLGRYSGATDLAVATAVAGRSRPELEDVVGFFVNTVVVRVDLAGDPGLPELLDRVRDRVLDAFSHADLPFDELVRELAPHRDPARPPLCDVAFGVRQAAPAPRLAGLAVRPVPVPRTSAKFDLTLELTGAAGGGYRLELEYATGLFTAETVRRMAGHFRALAGSAAQRPRLPISRLDLLAAAERAWLLRQPDPAAAGPETVPAAFAAQVARAPHAPAVIGAGGAALTYAELDRRSAALAGRLRAAGVCPEQPVAVYLERSTAAVVVLLAVLRAGGAYVPLDPAQPALRLAQLLADLRPALLVTRRRFRSRLGPVPAPVLAVDDPPPDGTPPDGTPPDGTPPDGPAGGERSGDPADDPDRAAYLIYTSGSTGRPKAVVVSHRAFAHHCRVHATVHDVRAGDRMVLVTPLTFDPAMEQIATPLLAGAAVVIGDPGMIAPSQLPDLIATSGATHTIMVTSYYREMIASVRPADRRLAGLRTLAVGGEVITAGDVQRWLATGPAGRFLCVYGPTEATVEALIHPVPAADSATVSSLDAAAGLPIGRPLPGSRAYVLDRTLAPAPVGVTGELYLAGPRLARGYLRQPRLTADRFEPDPFAGVPGERMYRTGDLARYRPDGTVEFLGRVDAQVKVRGFRIELGEVEAALASHPAVTAAAATVYEPAPGDRRLVGYVVPEPGAAPPVTELRRYLRDRLPEYMVPATVLVLAALPKTPHQKVDRQALPVPPAGSGAGAPDGQPPGTEVEEAIAADWATVLGATRVGIDQDFFDLGGHSLLATRLMVRLRDRFGLEIPLRLLFEATTVRAQAAALERLAAAPETGPAPTATIATEAA